jgi:haloalkane dehalogenase
MLSSIPGIITTMASAMWAKDHLPNIELIEIGEELHYAQESNPSIMGETISVWLQGVEAK